MRTCFLYLADFGMAQDAMQDTFVKVWRSMDGFQGRNNSAVKTWIIRIAINTCKDYRRSAWFRHVDLSKAIDNLPRRHAPLSEEARAASMDIMRLPAKLKQVVLLYHYHNLTMAETAEALGVNRITVSRRLQKAYAILRYELDGGDGDA